MRAGGPRGGDPNVRTAGCVVPRRACASEQLRSALTSAKTITIVTITLVITSGHVRRLLPVEVSLWSCRCSQRLAFSRCGRAAGHRRPPRSCSPGQAVFAGHAQCDDRGPGAPWTDSCPVGRDGGDHPGTRNRPAPRGRATRHRRQLGESPHRRTRATGTRAPPAFPDRPAQQPAGTHRGRQAFACKGGRFRRSPHRTVSWPAWTRQRRRRCWTCSPVSWKPTRRMRVRVSGGASRYEDRRRHSRPTSADLPHLSLGFARSSKDRDHGHPEASSFMRRGSRRADPSWVRRSPAPVWRRGPLSGAEALALAAHHDAVSTGPAGSGPDTRARELVAHIGMALGQPIVVENMPGAGGIIAHGARASRVARRPSVHLHAHRRRGHQPVAVQDLALRPGARLRSGVAGARIADDPGRADVAGHRVAGAVARPGPTQAGNVDVCIRRQSARHRTCSSSSSRPPPRCRSTTCRTRARPAWCRRWWARQVAIGMEAATALMPLIESGKVRALAVTGDVRMEILPQVPTFSELGVPGRRPELACGDGAQGHLARGGDGNEPRDHAGAGVARAAAQPGLRARQPADRWTPRSAGRAHSQRVATLEDGDRHVPASVPTDRIEDAP